MTHRHGPTVLHDELHPFNGRSSLNLLLAEETSASEAQPGVLISRAVTGFIEALAATCSELREAAKLHPSRIAYHMKDGQGGDFRTITRFEQGQHVPRDLDDIIEGYVVELNVPVSVIAKLTTDRLAREDDPQKVERALQRISRSTRKAPADSARKRPARRKPS